MAVTLPDARELSDEILEALRLRALHGCELGFAETEVAELLGVCRETVCHWWSAYADGGLDVLLHDRTGRPVGSGRLLSEAQADRIQQRLRTHQPDELAIAAPLWTRRAVGDLIRKEYNLSLATRTIDRYLQRWGFTAKKPRRHARDQDPEEVRPWLEETYPTIAAWAGQEKAEIHWGTKSAWPQTSNRHAAMPRADSRPRRTSPTRISERARFRRSPTRAKCDS